jgi:hypothetical protein
MENAIQWAGPFERRSSFSALFDADEGNSLADFGLAKILDRGRYTHDAECARCECYHACNPMPIALQSTATYHATTMGREGKEQCVHISSCFFGRYLIFTFDALRPLL